MPDRICARGSDMTTRMDARMRDMRMQTMRGCAMRVAHSLRAARMRHVSCARARGMDAGCRISVARDARYASCAYSGYGYARVRSPDRRELMDVPEFGCGWMDNAVDSGGPDQQ